MVGTAVINIVLVIGRKTDIICPRLEFQKFNR